MGLSPMSNYRKKKSFLVLTSKKFLKSLGSRIGTCSVFCHSFSLPNNVSEEANKPDLEELFKMHCSCASARQIYNETKLYRHFFRPLKWSSHSNCLNLGMFHEMHRLLYFAAACSNSRFYLKPVLVHFLHLHQCQCISQGCFII